ncbi:MAG: phosphatidylinositol-specific phospholipase C [Candidatus Competibacteraceae bacterium]|nr:phosphatidylinositol-specific phospholipase C [Candidatus Competibacteraceae bacterium]
MRYESSIFYAIKFFNQIDRMKHLKTRFCSLVVGLAVSVMLLLAPSTVSAQQISADDRYYIDEDTIDITLPRWMAWLPDNLSIAELSIPGTHDTMSRFGGDLVETQSLLLRAQLDAGVRALDIRARHYEDFFTIHHGIEFQNAYFGADVLTVIEDFLDDNPSETIIMRLGDTGVPEPEDPIGTYEDTFLLYDAQYPGLIWHPSTWGTNAIPDIPTLGDVRGKIVILQDFFVGSAPNFYGLRYRDEDPIHLANDASVPTIFDIVDLWNRSKAHLDEADAGSDDDLYIVYLSGVSFSGGAYPRDVSGGLFLPLPPDVAGWYRGTNDYALEYFFKANQTRTGVVMMDFPGPGIIAAIVAHNMRLADNLDSLGDDFSYQLFRNIVTSVYDDPANNEGDDQEAEDRSRQLNTFIKHVMPGLNWHSIVAKDEFWWEPGDFSQFQAFIPDDVEFDGYWHVMFNSEFASTDLSYNQVLDIAELAAAIGTGDVINRVNLLRYYVSQFYPEKRDYTALVKQSPGGPDNWWYEPLGVGGHVWDDDGEYAYALWFYSGPPDTTPPVITPTIDGTEGNNGWYTSKSVTVRWDVTDPESAVTQIGCLDNTIHAETEGRTITCEATSEGGTSTQSVTIKKDSLPPVVRTQTTPTANANGWHTTGVTVAITGEDAISGLDFCTDAAGTEDPVFFFQEEGIHQAGSATCTDVAGNESAPMPVADIQIDKTAPIANASATPLANANGWNNTDVTVQFSGADGLSGIDFCSDHTVLSTEGAAQSVSGTCTDLAGNASTPATASNINIDKTPPVPVHSGPFSVNEGSSIDLDGRASTDALSGVASTVWALDADNQFDDGDPATFQDIDESDNLVVLKVIDQADNEATVATTVTVNNVAPTITSVSGGTINEDQVATVSGIFTDPGMQDSFTVIINWGEGDPVEYAYPAGATSFSQTHHYLDDNPTATPSDSYPVTVVIKDSDGGEVEGNTAVIVNNVNPVARIDSVIDQLTGLAITYTDRAGSVVAGSMDVVLAGTIVDVVGSYTDTSLQDSHWAPYAPDPSVDWDDGAVDTISVPVENRGTHIPDGSFGTTEVASHSYAADAVPGPYIISLTVTDDDMGFDSSTALIRVVDASEAVQDLVDDIQTLLESDLSRFVEAVINSALNQLIGNNGRAANNGALDKLMQGRLNAAITKMGLALLQLIVAERVDASLDLSAMKAQLVLTAKSIGMDAIAEAVAIASKPNEHRKIAAAEALMSTGDTHLAHSRYVSALTNYNLAVLRVANIIK